MMWNATTTVSTRPVTQWIASHSNFQPRMGRKAVTIKVRIETAITQW